MIQALFCAGNVDSLVTEVPEKISLVPKNGRKMTTPQIGGAKIAGLMTETETVPERGTGNAIMNGETEIVIVTEIGTETVKGTGIVIEIDEEMTVETDESTGEGTVMMTQMIEDQSGKKMDIHLETWILTARKFPAFTLFMVRNIS